MILIGIAGGSGSGKTSIAKALKKELGNSVELIPLDCYYKDNSHLTPTERRKINFDAPTAFDYDLLYRHLTLLKNGRSIRMPSYSYIERTRTAETTEIIPAKIIILEGILPYVDDCVTSLIDFKFYIELSATERLNNIINRDVKERGRIKEEVTERFYREVNPMHNKYIAKQSKYADIIIKENNFTDIYSTIINHLKAKYPC